MNVPLFADMLTGGATLNSVHDALKAHYAGQDIVDVIAPEAGLAMPRIDAEEMRDTDRMKLYVLGGKGQINLIASLDNLGKGASGAAVQNLDLMLKRLIGFINRFVRALPPLLVEMADHCLEQQRDHCAIEQVPTEMCSDWPNVAKHQIESPDNQRQ